MSILTSTQDRKKYTPWILMCILTLVQIIGNVYSSYKYIMLNSPENLKYFKEPIFIWTDLPDAQATVIVTYVSAAILPIVALLMTSMITNYLTDQENVDKIEEIKETAQELPQVAEEFENPLINQNSILQMENQGLTESNKRKDDEIEQLKKQLEEAKNNENNKKQLGTGWTVVMPQNNEENDNENKEELKEEDTEQRLSESNTGFSGTTETEEDGNGEEQPNNDNGEQPMDTNENKGSTESELPENKMNSHFINL